MKVGDEVILLVDEPNGAIGCYKNDFLRVTYILAAHNQIQARNLSRIANLWYYSARNVLLYPKEGFSQLEKEIYDLPEKVKVLDNRPDK